MNLKTLVGSGDRIALLSLPFVVGGVALELANPAMFDVGGPPMPLRIVSIAVLVAGVAIWAWSVVLILTNVPQHQLITTGPYAWVRHPLYTAVAILILPWAGFLLNTWVGVLFGAVLYVASRIFAPAEEAELATTFGDAWQRYVRTVRLGWL